ncbi:MAG: threonylcarbamoyl-AMP synthase [Phycisphaeraceae bacterium]|nr:threonylcarbamoyl-AMP synthase [Phycisphaeraceae bacterium]
MTARDLIDEAVAILQSGGLVGLPTETVYGLAADALNPLAVAGIYQAKGRPQFNPLIVHVPDVESAENLVETWPTRARQLAETFWPGPLTLVLPRKALVPDIVTAGLPGVALRCPAHEVARELLRRFGRPLAAPSANRSGSVSPTTAQHVRDDLGDRVQLVLDGGTCLRGVESTVLSLMTDPPTLLRPGATAVEDIERRIGPVKRLDPHYADDAPRSPGMLSRHYATRTPLCWLEPGLSTAGKRVGLIALRNPGLPGYAMVEALSPAGDLREAAANLFAAMRRLDAAHLDAIHALRFPDRDLGLAINDRLQRATHG